MAREIWSNLKAGMNIGRIVAQGPAPVLEKGGFLEGLCWVCTLNIWMRITFPNCAC